MTRAVVPRYPIGFQAKVKHDLSEIIDDDLTLFSATIKNRCHSCILIRCHQYHYNTHFFNRIEIHHDIVA